MSSAAFMLNEQHIPLSVGNAVKMAEQGIGIVFQEQNFKIDFSPSLSVVIPFLSKQGKAEYLRISKMTGNAFERSIRR